MDALYNLFLDFIDGFVELLKEFGLWLIYFFEPVLEGFLYFIVDQFCSLIEWFIQLIDFKNDLFTASLSWSSMPDSMIWILNEIGFDNGLLIITSAIIIRLTLNLLPSWATRV